MQRKVMFSGAAAEADQHPAADLSLSCIHCSKHTLEVELLGWINQTVLTVSHRKVPIVLTLLLTDIVSASKGFFEANLIRHQPSKLFEN